MKLLTTLDRLHPRRLTLAAGALANARQATHTLTTAVEDRRSLAEALERTGDLERLSRQQCEQLLATRSLGRFAYIARAGAPDLVPVNYAMESEGNIIIRSAPGPKLDAARRHDLVAFEVDHIDEHTQTGWSVVVTGRAEVIAPEQPRTAEPEPWAAGPRRHTIRIVPQRIDGRRLVGQPLKEQT